MTAFGETSLDFFGYLSHLTHPYSKLKRHWLRNLRVHNGRGKQINATDEKG